MTTTIAHSTNNEMAARMAFLSDAILASQYYSERGRLNDASGVVQLLADYAKGITNRREETILAIMVEDWQEEIG